MCVVQSKCKMEEKLRILFIIGQITLKGLNAYYINVTFGTDFILLYFTVIMQGKTTLRPTKYIFLRNF